MPLATVNSRWNEFRSKNVYEIFFNFDSAEFDTAEFKNDNSSVVLCGNMSNIVVTM